MAIINETPMQVAAFFDFDKTILAVDSEEHEAGSLLRWERLPNALYPFRLLKMPIVSPLQERNWISPEAANGAYLSSYRGIHIRVLQSHARYLYKSKLRNLLLPDTLERLEYHRRQGHVLILVSASSRHLVEPFVEDFQLDAMAATCIETDASGICTGYSDGPIMCGDRKALFLKQISKTMNIDLQSSFAYSDHHDDIAFLQSVGTPVAVNPTRILGKIAKQKKWEVLRAGNLLHRKGVPTQTKTRRNGCGSTFFVYSILIFLSCATTRRLAFGSFRKGPFSAYSTIEANTPANRRQSLHRVCIISSESITHVEDSVSGSQLFYRHLVDAFIGRGFSVLVVEPKNRGDAPIVPYIFQSNNSSALLHTHRLPVKSENPGGTASFGPWALRGEVRDHILEFKPQLILVPDPAILAFDTWERPGHATAKTLNAPLVYDIHTNIVECTPLLISWARLPGIQTVLHLYHGWILNAADAVMIRTKFQLDKLRDRTGFTGRSDIVPLGSPLFSNPERLSATDTLLFPELSHCNTVFGWVGRLSPEKHIAEMLSSMDMLLQSTPADSNPPNVPCLLVAGPDQGELEKVQELERVYPQNVYYIGNLDSSQVAVLLSMSDALLFIGGLVDVAPRVVGEALQRQRPVISVTSPESTWWQDKSLPHVDLTITRDLAGELLTRMEAFLKDEGQIRTKIEAAARNTTASKDMDEGQAIDYFIGTLEQYIR